MLVAMRAGEFEFSHNFWPQNVPASDLGLRQANSPFRKFAS
jgi:hypothetical protein